MAVLRVDPWDPEYGTSLEFEALDELPQTVELDIEPVPWQPIAPRASDELPCCAFVDGVRRIDVRLFAEEDGAMAPALAGSWAVGAAWSTRPPSVGEIVVGRTLVVGGGLTHGDLTPHVGGDELRYVFIGVPGATPLDPIVGLQNVMREAEAALARRIFLSGEADLLVLDGPLTYFADGPIVGMIKRQSRSYLTDERSTILNALGAGRADAAFPARGAAARAVLVVRAARAFAADRRRNDRCCAARGGEGGWGRAGSVACRSDDGGAAAFRVRCRSRSACAAESLPGRHNSSGCFDTGSATRVLSGEQLEVALWEAYV